MGRVILVCEGTVDGLDRRLLDYLVERHGLPVELVEVAHAGGDRSLGEVAAYLSTRGKGKVTTFTIADRNYRCLSDVEATWSQASRRFQWTRHEIENYLLEPEIVALTFQQMRADAGWAQSLPEQVSHVEGLLRSLAGPLLISHAAKLLHEELLTALAPRHERELREPPLPLTASEGDWIDALFNEQERIRAAYAKAGAILMVREAIAQRMEALLEWVRGADFIGCRRFLWEIGGHELISALLRHIHGLGSQRLNSADLEQRLLEAFKLRYVPGGDPTHDFTRLMERLTAACRPAAL